MFIIDFDDTLFDTQRFKKARLEAVQLLGISDDEFWSTYRDARNSPDGLFTYSDERHADVLALRGFNREEVYTQLKSTTSLVHQFVFEDTFEFLEEIKESPEPMILLSLGNPGFQEIKTKGSGVHEYFDRTFMVHDTKLHVLEELFGEVSHNGVWFINDKIEETKKVLSVFPFVKAVMKQSARFLVDDYKESGLPYFSTLSEIAAYVRS